MAAQVSIEELKRQLEDTTRRAAAAEALAGTLEGELAEAQASLAAFKGAATRARNKAAVLQKQLSPEIRNLGAMRPAKSDEDAAARARAVTAALAGTSELVFSDGKREIRELAPLELTAEAWRETPSGHVLDHQPMLAPGDCTAETMELRGFALLNADGDQVGYCEHPPLTIGRNRQYQLPKGSIRF